MRNSLLAPTFAAVLMLGAAALPAQAALLTPDFADAPTGWNTDRFAPDSFSNVGNYQGRDNVLGIGISRNQGSSARPNSQHGDFYNTQGRQHAVSGGAGSTLAADLFIEESWTDATQGHVRTDMWGVTDNAPLAYPIIGFTNYGGAARYRIWDADTANGWVDLLTAVVPGSWVALAIEFTARASSTRSMGRSSTPTPPSAMRRASRPSSCRPTTSSTPRSTTPHRRDSTERTTRPTGTTHASTRCLSRPPWRCWAVRSPACWSPNVGAAARSPAWNRKTRRSGSSCRDARAAAPTAPAPCPGS
jgi:hypothetical protein